MHTSDPADPVSAKPAKASRNSRDRNLRFKNSSWFAYKKIDGRDFEKRLDTKDKGVARTRRDEWLRELISIKHREIEIPTFNDAAVRFADDHFPDLRPSSVLRYQGSLVSLIGAFGSLRVDRITHSDLKTFERARSKDVTGSTILRDFACLSVMFTRFSEWGIQVENPVKPYVRMRKRSKILTENAGRDRYLTIPEEMALMSKARDVMQNMIAVAVDTGLRRAELFDLEWTQVDLIKGQVTVTSGKAKSKKSRSVPLWPRSLSILRQLRIDNSHNHVFVTKDGVPYAKNSTTITDALNRYVMHAGIAKLSWHDLRRTCGCRLLQEHRFPMSYVSSWLGHSSVKVTERHYAFLGVEQLARLAQESLDRIAAQVAPTSGPELLQSAGYMLAGKIIDHEDD